MKKTILALCLLLVCLSGFFTILKADVLTTSVDTTSSSPAGVFIFEFDQATYEPGETVSVNVYLKNSIYIVDLLLGVYAGELISLPELAVPYAVNPYLSYETTLNQTGSGITELQIRLLSTSRDEFQYIRRIASFSFATVAAILDLESAFSGTNSEEAFDAGLVTFLAKGLTSTGGEELESDMIFIVKEAHPTVSFGTGVNAILRTLNHGELLAQSEIPAVPKNGRMVPLGWTFQGITFDFTKYPIIEDMALIPSYAMSEGTGCSFLKLPLFGFVLFPLSIWLIARKRME